MLRTPENLAYIRVVAHGLTPDGMQVRDAQVVQAFDAGSLPAETELRRQVTEVADHVTALSQAPAGEAYDGPVLFEAAAAAQLFGQLLGDNLKIMRKPIVDAGRTAPYVPSELENRIGSHILPEWMDVVDDPTQTEWRGHTLLGHYLYDIEGVKPAPLPLMEKGALKIFSADAHSGAEVIRQLQRARPNDWIVRRRRARVRQSFRSRHRDGLASGSEKEAGAYGSGSHRCRSGHPVLTDHDGYAADDPFEPPHPEWHGLRRTTRRPISEERKPPPRRADLWLRITVTLNASSSLLSAPTLISLYRRSTAWPASSCAPFPGAAPLERNPDGECGGFSEACSSRPESLLSFSLVLRFYLPPRR